jgi:hypothetical protein
MSVGKIKQAAEDFLKLAQANPAVTVTKATVAKIVGGAKEDSESGEEQIDSILDAAERKQMYKSLTELTKAGVVFERGTRTAFANALREPVFLGSAPVAFNKTKTSIVGEDTYVDAFGGGAMLTLSGTRADARAAVGYTVSKECGKVVVRVGEIVDNIAKNVGSGSKAFTADIGLSDWVDNNDIKETTVEVIDAGTNEVIHRSTVGGFGQRVSGVEVSMNDDGAAIVLSGLALAGMQVDASGYELSADGKKSTIYVDVLGSLPDGDKMDMFEMDIPLKTQIDSQETHEIEIVDSHSGSVLWLGTYGGSDAI